MVVPHKRTRSDVLLTRSPLAIREQALYAAVRLACVKHAASVQSEPGSNSSVQSLFFFVAALPRRRVVLNYSPEIEKGLCLFLHSFVSCEHFVIYLSHLAQAISTPTLIGSLFEFLKSCHCFRGDKDVNHTELKSFLQVRSKNYFFSLTFAHLAEHIVRAKGAHYARLFLFCQISMTPSRARRSFLRKRNCAVVGIIAAARPARYV